MVPTIISLILSVIIAAHISKKVRLLAFSFSLILLIPLSSYTLHGLSLVFADMTVSQVVKDSMEVVVYTLSEPVRAMKGESYNLVILIAGSMFFLSSFFGFVQMVKGNKSPSTV